MLVVTVLVAALKVWWHTGPRPMNLRFGILNFKRTGSLSVALSWDLMLYKNMAPNYTTTALAEKHPAQNVGLLATPCLIVRGGLLHGFMYL